jgi:hypothetical protein
MTKKEINKILEGKFGWHCPTWYAFQAHCDLYTHGSSNMSASSKQEYCSRIPKKSRVVDYAMIGEKPRPRTYLAGEARPTFDKMRCNWNACPKIKELIKSAVLEHNNGKADNLNKA